MSTTIDDPAPPTPAASDPPPRRRAPMPKWARFMLQAAAGIFVLTLVQAISSPETDRLTDLASSQSMLRWAVPIMLAGLGGVFSERAGVVNIGLEGQMVLGTWFGAWGAFEFGPWWGVAVGVLGGAVGGLIHAISTVTFGVDHIITGVAINILAPGVARYLSDQIFTPLDGGAITQSPRVDDVGDFTVPIFAGGDLGGWDSPNMLGWFGDRDWFFVSDVANILRGAMVQTSWLTLIAYALIPLSTYLLWRTRFGLRLRSCGEHPVAADSLGVDVYRYKYYGQIISGALAGFGGAFLVIELTGIYKEGQTNGRGFIGLAANIFGNWRPTGVALGSMLFGYVDGLQLRDLEGAAIHALLLLAAIGLTLMFVRAVRSDNRVDAILSGSLAVAFAVWYFATDDVPRVIPGISPFVVVLLVLVFAAQRLRMPAADGLRYRRGDQ